MHHSLYPGLDIACKEIGAGSRIIPGLGAITCVDAVDRQCKHMLNVTAALMIDPA